MTNFSLAYNEQVSIGAAFTDAANHPALVSNPSVVSSDENILKVVYTTPADPINVLSALVVPTGNLGTATVTVSGINPDGSVVTATQVFDIVAGKASVAAITVGTPSDIPVSAPVDPSVAQ